MTERTTRAMNNPYVCTIGHPTGRILNRRDPYEVDVSRLIREAAATNTALEPNAYRDRPAPSARACPRPVGGPAATNTALEHNAYVDRLDLSVPYMREAINAGVRITID